MVQEGVLSPFPFSWFKFKMMAKHFYSKGLNFSRKLLELIQASGGHNQFKILEGGGDDGYLRDANNADR